MLREALYNKTVNILVDAYFNDTLISGYCTACAVGNLVAANNGRSVDTNNSLKWSDGSFTVWQNVFCTSAGKQAFYPERFHGEAKQQIESTGYSIDELSKIEYAFETSTRWGHSKDKQMFNGLMAVIETLDHIHQNTDTELTKDTKRRFVKI